MPATVVSTTLEGPLDVHSDSTYVVNCFRDRWWEAWLANGWRNKAKKPVTEKLDGGLIRADNKILYPIREDIPVMLIDEGIPLDQAS